MNNTKLIIIDGITGSGKSTTAQFLAEQLKKNGIPVKWYHEEEDAHPLDYDEDIEVFASREELEEFLEKTPELWRQFVKMAVRSDRVQIIESFLLQDTIRLLFQNNLERERIISFAREIEEIIRPLNPALIYFYQQDVDQSIRRIWQRRGRSWRKWFIDSDIQTPYVKESDLTGEAGVIKLWSDYQDFTDQLFESYQLKKLAIENSAGDWGKYRQQIMDFLGLDLIGKEQGLSLEEKEKYCGHYQEQDGEVGCNIKLLNGELVCDLTWPDIRLLPVEGSKNYFSLESFPVFFKFKENRAGVVNELTLSGKKKLEGKVLSRVQ